MPLAGLDFPMCRDSCSSSSPALVGKGKAGSSCSCPGLSAPPCSSEAVSHHGASPCHGDGGEDVLGRAGWTGSWGLGGELE